MLTYRLAGLLMAAATLLAAPACNDDDFFIDEEEPTGGGGGGGGGATDDLLRLDGPNTTGPEVAGGLHRFGVQFFPEDLADFDGRALTGAQIFIGEVPTSLLIEVWRGGETVPGGLPVASVQVSSGIDDIALNDFAFDAPVVITDDDFLWITAEVEVPGGVGRPIGCDAGPNVEGGDWLWSTDRWEPYLDRTGGRESVNWNIRGIVGE